MRRLNTLFLAPQKLAVVQKEIVARGLSWYQDIFLVNEYPKSGGTWLKLMLSEALDMPAWTKVNPQWGSCVMQAHWLHKRGRCRTITLFRDGRDIMVSLYYHSFFRNEFQNAAYTEYMKKRFRFKDFSDIRSNLPEFMKITFDNPVSPGFNWADFVNNWTGRDDVVACSYEDLRSDTPRTLVKIVLELTGHKLSYERAVAISESHSIENMRKRFAEENALSKQSNNVEVSFLRKGVVGGWSGSFSDEALDWFETRAGDALDVLGYKRGRPNLEGTLN